MEEEKIFVFVFRHCNDVAVKFFFLNVKKQHHKLPTIYWLPKFINDRMKQGLLLIQVPVPLLNFPKY